MDLSGNGFSWVKQYRSVNIISTNCRIGGNLPTLMAQKLYFFEEPKASLVFTETKGFLAILCWLDIVKT